MICLVCPRCQEPLTPDKTFCPSCKRTYEDIKEMWDKAVKHSVSFSHLVSLVTGVQEIIDKIAPLVGGIDNLLINDMPSEIRQDKRAAEVVAGFKKMHTLLREMIKTTHLELKKILKQADKNFNKLIGNLTPTSFKDADKLECLIFSLQAQKWIWKEIELAIIGLPLMSDLEALAGANQRLLEASIASWVGLEKQIC